MNLHPSNRKTARFRFTVLGVAFFASLAAQATPPTAGTKSGASTKVNAVKSSSSKKDSNRREAMELVRKNPSLLASGKFREALLQSEKAIKLCPDLGDAYAQNAICLIVLNQFAPAEISAKKAIELAPKSAEAWRAYGAVFAGQGKIIQAIENLKKAVEVDPKSDSAWYSLGQMYLILDDARGKECFEKAVALDPKNSRYEQELGYMYHGMKKFSEAEKHYRKAIKRNPQNLAPWRLLTLIAVRNHSSFKPLIAEMSKLKPIYGLGWEELAKAYLMMGEVDKAAKCMSASKACPQDTSARGLVETAVLYIDLQNFYEAEKLLKRAGKLAPATAKIKKCLSVVYNNTDRTADAIKEMRRASYMEPNNTELLADLSTLLMESDLKESESIALKALNMNPKSPFLLSHLSCVLSRRNKIKEALKYAQMADQIGSRDAEVYHRIACTQINALDLKSGKRTCEKAIACDPTNFMSYFNLGVIYYRTDEPKLAQNALKRSLELNSKHCGTWEVLSLVLAELNDKKGAEDAFQKAVTLAPSEQKRYELAKYRSASTKDKKSTLRGILLPQLRTTEAPSSKL